VLKANNEKRKQYSADVKEDTTYSEIEGSYSLALTFKFASNLKLFISFL